MAAADRVLVVDDELSMREVLDMILTGAGFEVALAPGEAEARGLLEVEHFDAVLTDLYMGKDKEAGLRLLSWMSEHTPHTPAIMMTAHGSLETAIEAMKRGAIDYLQKPFDNDEVSMRVRRAVNEHALRRENEALRHAQARQSDLTNMVGKSVAFQQVLAMVRRVAGLPSTVAIHGESGAGKELVARQLHSSSNRADKPFVPINCGGIPESLLESELFGYKKGAFTGATEDKEGLFVSAEGGTVFLDEIGELPLQLQVKLLRVLDDNVVTPVGGTTFIRTDVRIISATNRDLEQMVEEGGFRKDLYYRLNVIPITVPALRDRAEDIPLLARYFVKQHARKMGFDNLAIAPEAEKALCAYNWPGNVRELGNVIERAMALCGGECIELEDLPPNIRSFTPAVKAPARELPEAGLDLESTIAEIEQHLIEQALERGRYSQKRAAQLLGLSARSLRYRLRSPPPENASPPGASLAMRVSLCQYVIYRTYAGRGADTGFSRFSFFTLNV